MLTIISFLSYCKRFYSHAMNKGRFWNLSASSYELCKNLGLTANCSCRIRIDILVSSCPESCYNWKDGSAPSAILSIIFSDLKCVEQVECPSTYEVHVGERARRSKIWRTNSMNTFPPGNDHTQHEIVLVDSWKDVPMLTRGVIVSPKQPPINLML